MTNNKHNIDYIIAANKDLVALKASSRELSNFLGGTARNYVPFLFYAGNDPKHELMHLQEIGVFVGNKQELATILNNTYIFHESGHPHASGAYSRFAAKELTKFTHFTAKGYGDKLKVPYSILDKENLPTTRNIEVRSHEELNILLNHAIPEIIKYRTKPKSILSRVKSVLKSKRNL